MKFTFTFLFLVAFFNGHAQVPFIDSLSAYVGQPNDQLTIYGTNFHPNPDSNVVRFGPVRATVVSGNAAQLLVEVPYGAVFGEVTVVCNGRTAWSHQDFLPTYAGSSTVVTPTFGGMVELPSGSSWVRDPRSADIDGDGKQDIIACGTSTASGQGVRVWHNVGNAAEVSINNWVGSQDFSLAATPRSMGVGDIDGDGKPDIVVVMNNFTSVAILRNTSTPGTIDASSFAAPVYYTCSGSPQDLELADIDGDGKLDVILGNHYFDGLITVFRNASTVGVIDASSLEPQVPFYAGQYNYNITVNDFNGDGKTDVAASGWGSDSLYVFVNNATSGVIDASSFLPAVAFETPVLPESIYSGDFNGDGKVDLITSHNNVDQIRVYENTRTSNVIDANSFSNSFDLATGDGPAELMVLDLTQDGKPEIMVANKLSPASVSVYQNVHSGVGSLSPTSFGADIKFSIAQNCQGLFASDVNGDNKPEILVTSANDDIVGILRNDLSGNTITNGMFGSKISWSVQATGPSDIGVADFDDDGKPDVFVSNNTGFDATVWPNNSTPGNVTYAAQEAGKFTMDWGSILTDNQVIDLDSDGKLDAVFNAYLAASWQVTHNIHVQGNPLDATSFDTSPAFTGIGDVNGPDHADLNKDGRADFVQGDYTYSFLRLSENTSVPGALSFAPHFDMTAFCCYSTPKNVTPDDLDNDGDNDLIISAASIDRIYFMENKGFNTLSANSFFTSVYMLTVDKPSKTFTVDINNDGWRDLVVLSAQEGLYIYLHNGVGGTIDGTMWDQNYIHLAYNDGAIPEESVSFADVNGDGKLDFAISSMATNEIVFWINNWSGGAMTSNDFEEVRYGVGTITNALKISDFDLDGKPDVYFTDDNNQFSMLRNQFGESSLPIISTFQSTDLCPGDSVTLFAPQADTYLWSNGDTTSSITVGTADNYDVIVTTAGISDTLPAVAVTLSPAIDVSIVSSPTICTGDTLQTVVMGTATTYFWSSGENTSFAIPTVSDDYAVTVVNSSGCLSSDTVTIQVAPEPVVTLWEDSTACFGQCIVLDANLNNTVQSVQWSPTTGLSDPNVENPTTCVDSNMVYAVQFVDMNGCIAKDTVEVFVSPLPELFSTDTVVCSGTSVQLSATPGGTYAWSPSTGLTSTSVSAPVANVQTSTTYVLNMTDAQGCSITDSVEVAVHPEFTIDLWADSAVCEGTCTVLNPVVSAGYTSVSWSPSNGLNDANLLNPTACLNTSETYVVTFEDNQGCITTDTVDMIVSAYPELLSNDTTVCEGASVQLAATSGGTYAWSPAVGLNSTSTATPTATVQNAVTYTLTMTSAEGCSITDSVVLDVHPELTIDLWADSAVCEGTCFDLDPVLSGSYTSATWTPATNLSDASILAPTVCASSAEQYQLEIEDANGCISTANTEVSLIPPSAVPTVTFDGTTLTASNGQSYQWYLDGQPISGATASTYNPTQDGSYTVEVTEAGSCPTFSDPYVVTDLGLEGASMGSILLIPNPTHGTFTISGAVQVDSVLVHDVKGKVIAEVDDPQGIIDLGDVERGTYYVHIIGADTVYVERLVVIH